ncbi:MAG: hypothetical protein FK734_05820 [Asgard group archaeon]|nr:hypothetical protein [Asgard group archaeon]
MKSKKMIIGLVLFSLLLITIPAVVTGLSQSSITDDTLVVRSVTTFNGSVSQGSDSTRHYFDVPASAILIEASLSFSSSYDFDFSMWDDQSRRTGGWTSSDHSLKENIPNSDYSGYSANPEWINVDPPATSGSWSVGCYSYSGSGSYTITVTITTSTADTTPPSVSITSPSNGATVSGTISITASASDNVGVSYVTFKVDSTTISTDSSSPYSASLNTATLSDGTHTIYATAYDAAGNYDQDSISITVDNGGSGDNELTSGVPVSGSLSSVGQTEMWYISVGSNAVSMRSVLTCGSADFDLYGRLNAEPTTSTYDWRGYTSGGEDVTYNNPGAGIWYIMVRDYSGSGSYQLTVTITYGSSDTTPPTVSITSPSNGATVSGTTTITASASDNVGVSSVVFYIDGSQVGTDTTASYTYSWDTTAYADGSHTIYARAYDAAGNYGTSTTITVTVDNGGGDNELSSGVPVSGSLSSVGQTEMWFINVAANAASMHSVLTCGSADFDLYGRLGAEPTTSTYDWRGYTSGGEDVTYNNPGAGIWYIMVRDYSGSGSYQLTVTITYNAPDTTPPTISITSPSNGATVSSATIVWSGSDSGSGINYYEVRIDGGTWINKGSSTSHTFSVADGSHTAEVRAWDVAGNYATDDVTFTVDSSQSNVEKYAVIVGISDYKAINDLSYCDEDATDWYNHLTGSQMDFDHIVVLGDGHTSNYPQWDGYANEYNIKQALTNMVNSADNDDIIAFMTSGHGAGNGYGSSYICAWDCGSGENGEDGDFYDTELAAILDDAVANKIFVFIDHCYSGGFGPELMAMGNGARVYLTTTCTDDGYGYDDPTHNNGAWTYYFLEYAWINHFGGSASVSMESIFDYAHAAYPYGGGDEPEEYDGNSSSAFYLA